eukprot:6192767-Pleurochrysis_carterae.AAC.3
MNNLIQVHGGAARKSECRRCRSSGGSGAGGNVESEASEGSESSSKADTPLESALPSILSNLRSSDWLLRMEGVRRSTHTSVPVFLVSFASSLSLHP